MATLELNTIRYRYPNTQAGVDDISLTVGEGKILCLVGASGCGKSTLLRLIAGFIAPAHGRIHIGGEEVAGTTWVPPEQRRIGLVFQQHALFPHLDVAGNILFGARTRDVLPGLLSAFRLEDKSGRYPQALSGGEQQRVALARALAAEPRILLMDEPFASIDSVLRRKIRTECIDVLRQRGITTLMVTHDAEEAMELADEIIVMQEGRIVQSGTAHQLYTQPVNASVAGLFGEINHLTDAALIHALTGNSATELLLRPEALSIVASGGVSGTVRKIHYRGGHYILQVAVGGAALLTLRTSTADWRIGDTVQVMKQ